MAVAHPSEGGDVESGVDTVVGAAGIMQGSADADEAPGLIKAQVGDDVRHPEAKAVERWRLDRERVVVDERDGRDQREAARRQVHRATLAGGGVFGDSVPEKPLPNWAV